MPTHEVYIPELLQDLSLVRIDMLDGGDIDGAAVLALAYDTIVKAWNAERV